ncbi:MAG: hypothetical protein P4N59_23255 [Negativicutes bacterium]|nr:hypothetical protein [Negativicutes bacterium]
MKLSRPNRKILGALILMLLMIIVAWKIALPGVTTAARDYLLSQASKSINGRLEVGSINLSPFGQASFGQVRLFNQANSLIAECELISFDFSPGDLWRGNLDLNTVRTITVDGLKLDLQQDEKGNWNIATITKPNGNTPFLFRGQGGLKNGLFSITTPLGRYEYREGEAFIDFAGYPAISLKVHAKEGNNALSAQGSWTIDGPGDLVIKSDIIDIKNYQTLLPEAFHIQLRGGTLSDVTITVTCETSLIHAEGTAAIHGVAAALDGTDADDGQAELLLSDGSLVLALAGSADNPAVKGSFQIAAGTLGQIAFTDASGEYSCDNESLSITNTQANALGGIIRTSGTLTSKTTGYVQHVAGQNIDSSLLIEEAVKGRVNFVADIGGRGEWRNADAEGSFSMASGNASGFSFTELTGDFTKRRSQVAYYNIRGHVADGLARVSGASDGDFLHLKLSLGEIQIATKTLRAPIIQDLF